MHIASFENEAFRCFIDTWGVSLKGFVEDHDFDKGFHIGMIGFKDRKQLREVQEELKDDADLFPHNMFASFDVGIKGINKGYGVTRVLEYLQIPKENAYAFGDGSNDLQMLENVGHPVIMANCNPVLKGRGFEQTGDVLDDGFYDYLLAHQLIKPF